MPTVSVYNLEGQKVGEHALDDAVFGLTPNPALLHQAVVTYLANQRVGTAATKTRAEVRGGGRKPWPQKHTGRARHGSIRSPLWRKGGVTFGPRPREFRLAMPKRARRLALRQALSSKVAEGALVLVDGWTMEAPKTRLVAEVLRRLGVDGNALIVTAGGDQNLVLSVRNLPRVTAMRAEDLNAYQVLAHRRLVMTVDAAERAEEVFGR